MGIFYRHVEFLLDEAHRGNIAVHRNTGARGLECGLLAELARHAEQLKDIGLTLEEVRPSNLGAGSLHQGGVCPRGRRKRYYSDTGEDAIIMWLDDLRPLAA